MSKAAKYRTPDSVKSMLVFADELGWQSVRTRHGWRLLHPSGATAMLHTSTSDHKGWRNLRCDLLRPIKAAAQ